MDLSNRNFRNKKMKKDVVAGLGEIGKPISKLISPATLTVEYDINPKLINKNKLNQYEKYPTNFLHVCIPFNKKFNQNVISLNKKFKPKAIVIHSTVSPNTTRLLQKKLNIQII